MRRRASTLGLPLLSLLDLFACGLGAALVLGLILMVSRERKPIDASPSVAIMFELEIEDPHALFTFLIKPPGSNRTYELGREHLAPAQRVECGRRAGFDCVLLGWSREGEQRLQAVGGEQGHRSLVLMLTGPRNAANGVWQVGVRYFTRDEPWDQWFGQIEKGAPAKAVAVSQRLFGPNGAATCWAGSKAFRLGDQHLCSIDITPP